MQGVIMGFPVGIYTGLLNLPNPQAITDNRDLVNPQTNNIEGARLIDQVSGDYVLTDTGYFVGMNDIEQKVLLALRTTYNSATSPIGQQLRSVRVIDTNIVPQLQFLIGQALSSLINSQYITLDSVVVTLPSYGSAASIVVVWTNLYTKTQIQSPLPMRQ